MKLKLFEKQISKCVYLEPGFFRPLFILGSVRGGKRMNTLRREAMKPQNIDPLSLEELYRLLQTFTNICSGNTEDRPGYPESRMN